MEIRIKRIYEMISKQDGCRVLVDRLWPRGVSKTAAAVNVWAKELAPSTELRKQYKDHDAETFAEFARKYRSELRDHADAVDAFLAGVKQSRLTLLYASKDENRNHAVVLKAFLEKRLAK